MLFAAAADDDDSIMGSAEKKALEDSHSVFFLLLASTNFTSTPSSQKLMASDLRSSKLMVVGLNLTDVSESTALSLDLCLELAVELDTLGVMGPVYISGVLLSDETKQGCVSLLLLL